MINWREFDDMFDKMFSMKSEFINNNNWTSKTYKSPDGKYFYTYLSKGFKPTDELDELKNKLDIVVEEQNFEEAVKLRDQIKSLEKNKEKISELQTKLDEYIKKQDFEKAIEYRDKIKALK
jgi:protein-arginine kinase activator protein McsA